jgi:hypothetical protein
MPNTGAMPGMMPNMPSMPGSMPDIASMSQMNNMQNNYMGSQDQYGSNQMYGLNGIPEQYGQGLPSVESMQSMSNLNNIQTMSNIPSLHNMQNMHNMQNLQNINPNGGHMYGGNKMSSNKYKLKINNATLNDIKYSKKIDTNADILSDELINTENFFFLIKNK